MLYLIRKAARLVSQCQMPSQPWAFSLLSRWQMPPQPIRCFLLLVLYSLSYKTFLPSISFCSSLKRDHPLHEVLKFIYITQWHPTPVLLPGKSHGWRSLVGFSSWGREESDLTERLPFHFSLSCIGEGNGNPLQCSCLENPRDGRAWWAAIYGVTQSRTRLKWLSSSSSSSVSPKLSSLIILCAC